MGDIKNYGIKREKKKVHKYVFIVTIIMALIYVITSLIIYWYVHHSTKLGLKLNTKLSEHLQKMKEMKMPEWLKAYDNCKELQQSNDEDDNVSVLFMEDGYSDTDDGSVEVK